MEVIKENDIILEYRYYQWNGYTPLGMVLKKKDAEGAWKEYSYYYWTNQRGDVISVRNNSGDEVGSYNYDAYGNILVLDGEVAKENSIRYAGYYYDTETKNYYLQARYYNPDNGAFLALDSHPGDSGEPLSQNGYTYGNNNPMKYVDPFGKFSMRTEAIKRIIDSAMSLIPAGRAVQLLLKSRNHSQITRRMGTASIRVVTDTTDTALSRMGVNKKARRAIIASMANTFAIAIDFTVGGMVVRIMRRYFKTYDKKAKAYGWWGPKVSYEYMKLW